MENIMTLEEIRENERKSHITMYSAETLYKEGSWLSKPIKTIADLIPYFQDHAQLQILDLGCGVGRNCIYIAQQFKNIQCSIDCVDILDIAIEKLRINANQYNVSQSIRGIVDSIENYHIRADHYDWILAVSALEHVDSKKSFIDKLIEIKNGIRENGIVCLVLNSNVQETEKISGLSVPAQFEVNLPTEELQNLLSQLFSEWRILKSTIRKQQYDIPRGNRIHELQSDVVTFVAIK